MAAQRAGSERSGRWRGRLSTSPDRHLARASSPVNVTDLKEQLRSPSRSGSTGPKGLRCSGRRVRGDASLHCASRRPEQLEPGDREVPVEGECVCHPVSTHDLETDGVSQRELLIGEASQPSADCVALEVRGYRKPLMHGIVEQCGDGDSRCAGAAEVQEV